MRFTIAPSALWLFVGNFFVSFVRWISDEEEEEAAVYFGRVVLERGRFSEGFSSPAGEHWDPLKTATRIVL